MCLQLEFWLQLYFAVYPVLIGDSHLRINVLLTGNSKQLQQVLLLSWDLLHHPVCTGRLDDSSLMHTLPAFKHYLDTHGPLLANDPQLLSYYALPYVRNPQSHPAFAHIFTPTFVSDLRSQLSNVLHSASTKSPLPRLYSMYTATRAARLSSGSAALQSDGKSVQPGLGLNQRLAPPDVASKPVSRAVHCNSRASGREMTDTSRPISGPRELTGNSRPFSGKLLASNRPISALLNGSKELADLVSVSKPRYVDQSTAPSLEPSAEILHGQYASLNGRLHIPWD